jgi:hypothetical protein
MDMQVSVFLHKQKKSESHKLDQLGQISHKYFLKNWFFRSRYSKNILYMSQSLHITSLNVSRRSKLQICLFVLVVIIINSDNNILHF